MHKKTLLGISYSITISVAFLYCSIVDYHAVKPELLKIVITEIHYHPRDDLGSDGDEFEFIELFNAHESAIALKGVAFTNGIDYEFADTVSIQSGAFLVLSSNPESFNKRYGFDPDGVYTGNLRNSGEKIVLEDIATDVEIFSVTYLDSNPWPVAADGYGFSLVPSSIDWSIDQSKAENWMRSSTIHGSPGTHDAAFDSGAILSFWYASPWVTKHRRTILQP